VAGVFGPLLSTGKHWLRWKTRTGTKIGHWSCLKPAAAVSLMRGAVQGYRGTYRDVTRRKQAEEELREARRKYRTILENIEAVEVDIAGT